MKNATSPPDRLGKILYTVELQGFSDNPVSQLRLNNYAGTHQYMAEAIEKMKFPCTGWVIGLNRHGEAIVVPEWPGHGFVLSYFKWVLV